ncbi:sulfur carrier protein ThiS [uncultured Polaribacter sp.]|mgnify:CR=1 FL=1|uniref:sulfur carrier protein ThiS n=1 Tax=uncultured Polaribacter sp. TaxID=174711 RepID=UPI002636F034|nr:sulfur carrier protein ThiS [uncultured Polaribacter sp.]
MITINVNQENQQFSKEISIEELICFLKIKTNGIAIAVNSNVVKKENWSSNLLHNNDKVLIIKSTQGG